MNFNSELILLFLCMGLIFGDGQVIIREIPAISAGDSISLNPSHDSEYPEVGGDVIWKIIEPIEIKIKSFNIDSQIGDYLLISKYPFPQISGELSPEKLINLLPLGEGNILTGRIQTGRSYRLIPATSGFLYFHGEYGNRHPEVSGFTIEITPFDKTETKEPTSSEPSITTPVPLKENFVEKFLVGNEPYNFIREINKFKTAISTITNSYCATEEIELTSPATLSDVKIAEVLFCDRGWSEYLKCVEVNFAISIYDTSGNYVMIAERINDMWNKFCAELGSSYGYECYTPPNNPESPTAWIWVAISLSIILILSLVLCLAWIKKASDELKNDSEIAKAIDDTVTDVENFYDKKNPIKDVLRTFTQGKREKEEFVHDLMQKRKDETLEAYEHEIENTTHHNSLFAYQNGLFESDEFNSTESDEEDITEFMKHNTPDVPEPDSESSGVDNQFRLRRISPTTKNDVDTLY